MDGSTHEKKFFFNHIILILLITPVLWSCGNTNTTQTTRDEPYYDERDNDSSPRSSGGGSLRRVGESSINYARFKKSDFSGEDCDEDSECRQLCRDMRFDSDICGDLPQDMVETLFSNFEYLRDARNRVDQTNPSAFGTFLHEDKDVILRILKNSWSRVDILNFLNWVANTPQSVKALQEEDDENELLLTIFSQFNADIKIALLEAVGQHTRDTFIAEAIKARNDEAIILALSLIPSADERGIFFCKRQEIDSARISFSSSSSSCHYSSEDRIDQEYCYTHGPTIWSYINSHLFASDIGELPDKLKNNSGQTNINEDSCGSFCRDHGNSCTL